MSRKKCNRRRYKLVNPVTFVLDGIAVTPKALLDKLRFRELSAIEAFRTGKAGKQEWLDIADLLNICETLSRDGVGPEALEPCLRAQEALGAAHARYFGKQGSLVLTGPELQALREAYEYADLQRVSIPRSQYEHAIEKTANRIRSSDPSIRVCISEPGKD